MSEPRSTQGAAALAAEKRGRWGIGLRRPHFDAIFTEHEGVDVLEVISENFMYYGGRAWRVLEDARDRFPVIAHGVGLSIVGPDPLDEDYLQRLTAFVDWLDPPWYSDHLSYTRAFGVQYHDLIPFPFNEEVLEHVAARVRYVQDLLGRPFLAENSSYYATFAASTMSEAEFFVELMARTGCGMLLDVNNVYVNACNHGYDARAFIEALPAERVLQYHMAGHDASGPFLVDTHGARAIPEVLALYQHALRHTGEACTIFEWDNDIPPLADYLGENRSVRRAAEEVLGARPWAEPEGRVMP